MRWYILRTLLYKEVLRHLADRGLIFIALLLLAAGLLLSLTGKSDAQAGALTGGLERCCIDFGAEDPWIQHLMAHVPPSLDKQVYFRSDRPARKRVKHIQRVNGMISYNPGEGAIQVWVAEPPATGYVFRFWHPSEGGGELAVYEAWFWKEWCNHAEERAVAGLAGKAGLPTGTVKAAFVNVQEDHQQIKGAMDFRSVIAMALVFFSLYIPCVYLLPSLTCEERERGILLAQALSPASPLEILVAKFLFYPALGIGLAALVAGIYNSAVLTSPFFWMVLVVSAWGTLGVGMTIASLARTQRKASLGALCYILAIALITLICQQNNLPLSQALVEYHLPRMVHPLLQNKIHGFDSVGFFWWNFAGSTVLAGGWVTAATLLFRRRGWQ